MTSAQPITMLFLSPLLTTALLTPNNTPSLSFRSPSPCSRRHITRLNQVLQPQKGGIVVESPSDGFIARDPLLDAMMGRGGGSENNGATGPPSTEDDVILGGNPTFASRSSGRFAPSPGYGSVSSGAPRPPSASAPRPPEQPPNDLPLFPDLKKIQLGSSGPRRISLGESAVFERAVSARNSKAGAGSSRSNGYGASPTSARSGAASANGYGVQTGQSGSSFGSTNFNNNFGTARGGVSIKGDSSIFSSTGFVSGGGSTSVYSSGGQGSSFGSRGGNNYGGVGSARNAGGNVGNSFRDGTGRDYSSAAGAKFGNVMSTGKSSGGVSIKGDSSIFSSTGYVDGNSVSSSGYGTPTVSAGAGRPNAYNSQHVFDAPSSASYAPSYNNGPSNSDGSSAYNAPSYNTGQPSGSFGSNLYSSPSPSNTQQNQGYNTGQSTADNFLSSGGSVKRSRSLDSDDDDDDMLGYDSPYRRGDSFLSEPDPQFVGQPIHNGKWMSELYLEQGLDALSGGMEGYGVVMGEMQRGGGGGAGGGGMGGVGGGGGGYASSAGTGYATSGSGYASNDGYRSNNSYASNDGYGSNNSYASNDGYGSNNSGYGSNGSNSNSGYSSGSYGSEAGGGFRGAPPGGY